MEPSDTFLMGDEVISTTLERENNEFVKFSVDDLVPIPKESEVKSVYDDLECDMPITIPLPTTDVREENFDINSPLGEYVVDFLMENEDVAGLLRHLICLREVEIFDHFFSLTRSGGKTRVMETPSFGFHHMPSPRPDAYSHTETDRRYIRLEIDVVRGQRTTYKPELQERQSAEDLVVTQMMRIHKLEARARTNMVEDASSSC
nr:hypothetical protein [Tanacetum cinerariifolium]